MNRDPFFRQIIGRLAGPLDPYLFEACAADLLRAIYPTLVPIRGGDDAGMDGAIADAQGEPFPLVTTTGNDVSGNLKRNLRSYLADGGTRRKVVLATSQHLSAQRRRNLSDRATELGFTLIHIHDQEAMAYFLYRSPEWCHELLNLTGDPSPLSAVPRTSRPQLLCSLIGRDEDIRWLHETTGDRLLVGQPGVGKTSLLLSLVSEGKALFVISQDRGEIAAALRAQEHPIILIVDDAHLYTHVVKDLIQLRLQTGADFSILASCWPSFMESIAGSLSFNQVRNIDLLSRDDIVAVVKSAGVRGPTGLIKEIVDQASGRPGLAVTLSLLYLQEGLPDLISGVTIKRTLYSVLDDLRFHARVRLLLASFAIGGDVGMSVEDVAVFAGVSRAEVWEIVTLLHESGFVYDFSPGYVSVQPPALRHVLVRDAFFSGVGAPPVVNLIDKAPRMSEVASTLLGVRARGGRIPEWLLIDVLRRADSRQAWEDYAWMGESEAQWVFANLPQSVTSMAGPLLANIPVTVIPALLQAAVSDQRSLNVHPDHTLRLLGDWVKNATPNSEQAVSRRQMLLKALRSWLQENENSDVALASLQLALFPAFEVTSTDPGLGNTLTLQFGLLSAEELTAVAALWEEGLGIVKDLEIESWKPIQQLIENWAYPGRVSRLQTVPDEICAQMQAHAGRMLTDIMAIVHHRPGIMHWAAMVVRALNLENEVVIDNDFLILFPLREWGEEWQSDEESEADAVRQLAERLCEESPESTVRRIAYLEAEAQQASVHYPRWTPYLCTEIARQVNSMIPWLRAFTQVDAAYDLLLPFLNRAAESGESGWEEYVLCCAERQCYLPAAVILTLRLESPPKMLFNRVWEELSLFSQIVGTLCLRNEVPEATVARLLRHDNKMVALATAKGEWFAEPKGTVRESMYDAWRSVVVRYATEEYWLKQVFREDPPLALSWLDHRLANRDYTLFGRENSIRAAVDSLSLEDRKRLLELLSHDLFQSADLVEHIVGDDLEIYATLLTTEKLQPLHLAPLQNYPGERWIQMAKMALDNGYRSDEVARVLIRMPLSWTGEESAMWERLIEELEPLHSHQDERLRAIGIIALKELRERKNRALKRERNEAVFGRR